MRRWWLRGGLAFLLLLAAALGVLFWNRHREFQRGDEAIAAAVAEIEKIDPHWRWEDIEAAREPVPDERNMADIARQLDSPEGMRAAIPAWKGWEDLTTSEPDWPLNEWPPERWLCELEALRPELGPAYQIAREMVRRGGNRIPYVLPDDVWSMDLSHVQGIRQAAALLRVDAIRHAAFGQHEKALPLTYDVLTLAESLRDEPIIISQLVRVAMQTIAIDMLERTLASGELPHSERLLLALSARLARIARRPVMLPGLRGERAQMDAQFRNVESGKLSVYRLVPGPTGAGGGRQSWNRSISEYLLAPAVRFWHAEYLRRLTAYIAIVEMPKQQWAEQFANLPPMPSDRDYSIVEMLLSWVDKVVAAERRIHGQIGCARVAIACETFRLRNGRWPTSLSEIPADLLPEMPADPYNGAEPKLVPVPGGLVVHVGTCPSLQRPLADDLDVNELRPPGFVGFRLWDAELRGLDPTTGWPDEDDHSDE